MLIQQDVNIMQGHPSVENLRTFNDVSTISKGSKRGAMDFSLGNDVLLRTKQSPAKMYQSLQGKQMNYMGKDRFKALQTLA